MPKQQKELIVDLIRSMTKSEKRSFRLFANMQNSKDDKLFVVMFDYIDSGKYYSEEDLLKKHPQIKKTQIPNIKSNLLKHLLVNLRHLHRSNMEDITIREMLDNARILQAKGLYRASLDLLERARKSADDLDDTILSLAALDIERKIENQYITGSMAEKANQLKEESIRIVNHIQINNDLANLSLLLYGLYLKYGYVKDKKDYEFVKVFFDSHLPKVTLSTLSFYDKIYYYQSYVWYHHMLQDFANYYKYAQKWIDEFNDHPQMIFHEYTLYIKGLHNALNALFMANKQQKFLDAFDHYCTLEENVLLHGNFNDENNYFLFKNIHLLNKIMLLADYDQGVKEIKPLTLLLKSNKYVWDINRLMVFYYKVACVYFGADDYSNTLDYLNKITNYPISGLRLDIQGFARILSLITHYELGNETLVKYQIMSVYRFLLKLEDLQSVHKEILNFLKKTPKMTKSDVKSEFIKLRNALSKFAKDPYERRPFLYLDIIGWLDSKIEKKRIQQVIRERKESVI